MLHTCAARFDVTGNLEKFCELNKDLGALSSRRNAARVTSSAFRFREAPGFEIHKILFY